MQYCFCGDLAHGAGTRCARCAALDVLELKADASESEIKEAYRLLVKVWHPDRFQSDKKLRTAAEDKLKAVNSAYVFLTSRAAKRDHRKRTAQADKANAHKPDTYKPDTHKTDAPGVYTSQPRVAVLRRGLMPSGAALVGFGALACGVLIVALAFKSIDSSLASDPTTGRIYSELRASVANSFRQAAGTVWSGAGQHVRDLLPQRSTAAAAVSQQPEDAAQPAGQPDNIGQSIAQSAHKRELGAAHAAPIKLLPYVTVGLTRDEVIAIDGAPAAAADGKLVYPGAELDFTDGKVSGWKIDPASASIRVKLWPNAPVDPDLDSFGVGSSKNVVLVVEGTPTNFSGNKFGYGGSEVYFQNDRVVSWKEDPAWPLRTAPR